VNAMTRRMLATALAAAAIGSMGTPATAGQDTDELRSITARVHGTFEDHAGGLGVLSGDMTIARFEVVNGSVTAIGRIVGAMADSAGAILGPVDQELAFAVANVASTCNQLRMDLAATDVPILEMAVHFDKEVAGFDSREGTTPKARPVLCAADGVLRDRSTADTVTRALNEVVTALAVRPARNR
jgi:hypothetical protein